MTKLPLAQTAQPFKMTLEAAVFDWRSMRVQFFFGFSLTMICVALVVQEFFATRFLPQEYIAVEKLGPHLTSSIDYITKANWSNNPLLALEVFVFGHHTWWYRALTFLATSLTALTASLIALDISIRYGNRIGAAPAVFTTLLYMMMPLCSSLVLPANMLPIAVSNLLALYAIFLDMRFRLLNENPYFWVSLLCLILSGALDARGAVATVVGIALCRLFITEQGRPMRIKPLNSYMGLTVFFLTALLFVGPHLSIMPAGSTPDSPSVITQFLSPLVTGETIGVQDFGRGMQRALPILFATVFSITTIRLFIGSIWLRPLFFAGSWLTALLVSLHVLKLTGSGDDSAAVGAIFIAPPLCILLSLSALPAIDILTKKSRIIFTAIGAIVLSGIILCWGLLLMVQVRDANARARELQVFKIQLTHRMQTTQGKLVVINPPFDSSKEIEQNLEQGEKTSELPLIREREEAILIGLLNSPLANHVIPIATTRKQNITFVRLSKKEHATPDPNVPATAVTDFYAWSKELGQLMPLYYVGAHQVKIDVNSNLKKRLRTDPREISKIPATEWEQLPVGQGYIEKLADGLGLHAGDKDDLYVWFPHESLDPTKCKIVKVRCSKRVGDQDSPVYLIFKGKDSDDPGIIELAQSHTEIGEDMILEASTRGSSEWTRHSAISAVGIKLPAGSEGLVLKSIETTRGAK
ncbi:MAG: hypothetical protein SGJ27_17855 [Candidatus Melainabacteria bacterium]|nr:hypothetical protein [Candidatus Melainabacteria bacterium]